mgnify:CR=1 FL=1
MYCNVIITRPFNKAFTYEISSTNINVGQVVLVPFGKSLEVGLIIENNVKKPNYKIKTIVKVYKSIFLDESLIKFIYWIKDYTLAPIGSVLKLFLINKKIIDYKRSTLTNINLTPELVSLNNEQKEAKKNILNFFESKNKPVVLEGVTGSGKTEVYFEIIEKFLNEDKQILIMLPEISLTPQLENRFFKRFGIEVDIWHSKISDKKRQDIWHRAFLGTKLIVIGARSSLFLPFSKLGLIIVDEEHDTSYKQEDNIRYQARDLAVVRSQFQKIKLILSSATPSLETQNNINTKKYNHVFLSKQYSGLPLPNISLIDLTKNKLKKDNWISNEIFNQLNLCFEKNEQALIFLNRRGYSPLSLCNECGYRFKCEQCSSWLVMHQQKKRLLCHHCGTINQIEMDCPNCKSKNSIKFIGPGVERVAEELKKYFPKKNITIMSSDIANTTKKIKSIINKFTKKEIDILVATQIMAKGYDFSNLSFVAVIDADAGLFGGDLRAIEKTFNLLQQVSGRAGRSKQSGNVMIQTYYPQQPIIQSLKNRNRASFILQALKERKQFRIPPFSFMTSIILSGSSKNLVKQYAFEIVKTPKSDNHIDILGPVEAPIHLLRGKYRFRILLRGNSRNKLNKFTLQMLEFVPKPSSTKVIIDVDPYSFM